MFHVACTARMQIVTARATEIPVIVLRVRRRDHRRLLRRDCRQGRRHLLLGRLDVVCDCH